MSAVVLGYFEHCEKCSRTVMLTQPSPGFVCSECSGEPPQPADELIWDRISLQLQQLVREGMQQNYRRTPSRAEQAIREARKQSRIDAAERSDAGAGQGPDPVQQTDSTESK